MNINDLLQINTQRAARWHNGDIAEWSPLEWAGAMAGEAGEAANAAKKLKRLEGGLASINEPALRQRRSLKKLPIPSSTASCWPLVLASPILSR